MGLIHIMERGGSDYRDYKKHLRMAKEAIDAICDITEDMEEQLSERSGAHMRGGYYRDGYYRDGEMEGMHERRGRDSMGRYR